MCQEGRMFTRNLEFKVKTGKHLSDEIPTQNGLKQGDALSPLFQLSFTIHH